MFFWHVSESDIPRKTIMNADHDHVHAHVNVDVLVHVGVVGYY